MASQHQGSDFDNFYEEIEQPELIESFPDDTYKQEAATEGILTGLSEDDLRYLVEDQRSDLTEVIDS